MLSNKVYQIIEENKKYKLGKFYLFYTKKEFIKMFYDDYVKNIQFLIKNKKLYVWFMRTLDRLYFIQKDIDEETRNMSAEMGLIKALDDVWASDENRYVQTVMISARDWITLMNTKVINHVNEHLNVNWKELYRGKYL